MLDGQLDAAVNELAEGFIGGEALFDLRDTVSPDEAANGLATMDVSEFVVGAVTARMLRVHAATAGAPTDLILQRDTSGMHGAELQ